MSQDQLACQLATIYQQARPAISPWSTACAPQRDGLWSGRRSCFPTAGACDACAVCSWLEDLHLVLTDSDQIEYEPLVLIWSYFECRNSAYLVGEENIAHLN